MNKYIENVINKKFDEDTIDFLFNNSIDDSILRSTLKLIRKSFVIIEIGNWKFEYVENNKNNNEE